MKQDKNIGYCPFNPGYLKLLLTTKGMKIGKGVESEISNTLRSRRGVAGGVEIILPGDMWVNVPTEEDFAHSSPLSLEKEGKKLFITGYGENIEVELVPQPGFYEMVTSKGTPFYKIAALHGSVVHITAASKCHFFDFAQGCLFCQERAAFSPSEREFIPIEEVLEIVEAVFNEGSADSVELNLGFYDSDDRGVLILEPYIKAIKRNFDTVVAVDVQPPKTNKWVDQTYAMGADRVSYHMEIFDKEIFAKLCPGKASMIGWNRFAETLQYAAEVFPSGSVSSNLIVGLEPAESTMKGIDFLTNMGVMPILPIFRPLKGTSLEDIATPDIEEIAPIYGHLYSAVRKKNINMTWSKNVSTYMTPLEGRYFVGEDAKLQVAMQNMYKSKIGGMAVRGLAGLRRRLKVKNLEEPAESSDIK